MAAPDPLVPGGADLAARWSRLGGRVVDLSLPIAPGAPHYPGDPAPAFAAHDRIETAGYAVTQLVLGSHQGTHLDAPAHYLPGGDAIDAVDLGRCVGPAVIADLPHKGAGAAITPADLEAAVAPLAPGARLVIRTGWDRMLGDPAYFTACPSLTIAAARWLAARELALLGMDMPTPSVGDVAAVHQVLLGAGVLILEALAHLEQIIASPFVLVAAPLRLVGVDGSPVRALALLPAD